ncbi:MAG TPA: DUF4835 family protein [Bacteroidia bacterium]|nr:DUF4835 family protein [Bacteroidia bacterium]HNT80754.1 DUF4835 family protein [Bacteroidia bacterium]
MKYLKIWCPFVFFVVVLNHSSLSQELNCRVSILTPQIQATDKSVFQELQQAIFEFVSNRSWTDDKFLAIERIECNMQITIKAWPSQDEFEATMQLTANRPIFGTSYDSPIINLNDEAFNFKYQRYQQLEYSETGNTSNLTSLIAYYVNIVLGVDYDSYSPLGGSGFFAKAQGIVNNMQSSPYPGWRAFDGTKNRYILAESLNNNKYRPIRSFFYNYHRKGLDMMTEKKEEAMNSITASIEELRSVHREYPNSMLMQVLFLAKADEVVNIYSQAFPDAKNRVVNALNEIDPGNIAKYQQITGQ